MLNKILFVHTKSWPHSLANLIGNSSNLVSRSSLNSRRVKGWKTRVEESSFDESDCQVRSQVTSDF